MVQVFTSTKAMRYPGFYTIPVPEGWEYRGDDNGVSRMWTTHPDGSFRRFLAIYRYFFARPWEPTHKHAEAVIRGYVEDHAGWVFDPDLTFTSDNEGWPVVGYIRFQKPHEKHGVDGPTGFPILWLIHAITGKWGYVLMEFAINDPARAQEAEELGHFLADSFMWAPEAIQNEAVREALEQAKKDGPSDEGPTE